MHSGKPAVNKNGTPSFTKRCSIENSLDEECDLDEELIDEHNGKAFTNLPISSSSRANEINANQRKQEKALKSIENVVEKREQMKALSKQVARKKLGSKLTRQQSSVFRLNQLNSIQWDLKNGLTPKYDKVRFETNIKMQIQKKQKKIENLKKQIEKQKMKECTFSPNTNTRSKTPTRNLEQFLQKQNEHIEKVQKKREQLKKKRQEVDTTVGCFRPKINKKSGGSTNRGKPAYQRLYKLNEIKLLKQNAHNQQKQNITVHTQRTTSPLNSQRSLHLYEDAARRQDIARSRQRNLALARSNLKQSAASSKNSTRYYAQRFLRKLCQALTELKLLPNCSSVISVDNQQASFTLDPQSNPAATQIYNRIFDQQEFGLILCQLGFLVYEHHNECSKLAEQQRSLRHEAYTLLHQWGLNICNLCVFLLAILGVFNAHELCLVDRQLGVQGLQIMPIDEAQGRKMQKYFDLLHRNWLTSKTSLGKSQQTGKFSDISPSHSNYISPRHEQQTEQLALKYRSKMIERANQRFQSNNIDIELPTQQVFALEDLLVIDNLGRNLQMKRLKQKQDKGQDAECTFHPKINNSGKEEGEGLKTGRGVQKSKYLYEYAKRRQKIQKQSTTVHDQSQALTDRSHKEPKSVRKHANVVAAAGKTRQPKQPVKDIDKAISRMVYARMQRELKNKYLQRGEPSIPTPTVTPFTHGVATDEQPFLVIDVNMGEETQHMQFYQGDEQRLEAIVDDFCMEYDVDEESKEQLLDMVELEIRKYLHDGSRFQ